MTQLQQQDQVTWVLVQAMGSCTADMTDSCYPLSSPGVQMRPHAEISLMRWLISVPDMM